jgi:hypothetical protein
MTDTHVAARVPLSVAAVAPAPTPGLERLFAAAVGVIVLAALRAAAARRSDRAGAGLLAAYRVARRDDSHASTSSGTRRLPTAPAAPAKKIFMTHLQRLNRRGLSGYRRSVSSGVHPVVGPL